MEDELYQRGEQQGHTDEGAQNPARTAYEPDRSTPPEDSRPAYKGQPCGQSPYMQPMGRPPYGQNPYEPQAKPPKGDGIGFGIASLSLGVASIFLFSCCVNYITAVLAIVFGVLQIVKNRQRGLAVAGIVTAAVSVILGTVLWIGVAVNMEGKSFDEIYDSIYDEFYNYYEDQYPLNDYTDGL